METRQHTLQPTVTGSSVLGIKYKDGVMIASDCLASYGSLARYTSISRIFKMNDKVLVACSGDYADFQYIKQFLTEFQTENNCLNDQHEITSHAVFSYLTRILYNRRSKFNPLMIQMVIAGVDQKNFHTLGYIDYLGFSFEEGTIGTGYGAYLALPILRNKYEANPNMNEEEAKSCLEECLRVLFYRDARSSNKIEIAKVTNEGISITKPYVLDSEWKIAYSLNGYE